MKRTYRISNMKVLIVLSAVVVISAGYTQTGFMPQGAWTHSDVMPHMMPYTTGDLATHYHQATSDLMMRYRRDIPFVANTVLNHQHIAPVIHHPVVHAPIHESYIHEGIINPHMTHLVKRSSGATHGGASDTHAPPPQKNDRYPELQSNPETNLYTNKKPSGEYASNYQKN